ncbi:class I SAM-dependent DNA methyltransferase [Magnetospirillum fulvum]|uniref:Type 12 methyltransferase n=1 Tax=Magnetospirillum fulvum MGU-K5 TaxID=1316936 RepID=S9TVX7_MAGFU|nr:class I SAM-dependent methyltransferase [Magnetospirillum fulvum]EPY02570.1 type 12 methyltransferase [Magnetospirillum fulvum MGU-K5]
MATGGIKESDSNDATLRTYRDHVQDYIDGTAQSVSGATQDWIDAALAGLPDTARLLELGSAFGRDAAYIESHGFALECTDAVPEFVACLQAAGHNARLFNALTDDLNSSYDLIFANAVLLHFTRDEFASVLGKMLRALAPGGRFAFSLKRGEGESWSSAKVGAPRFFCYWEPEPLDSALRRAGFFTWTIDEARTGRAHPDWLYVIARAPG